MIGVVVQAALWNALKMILEVLWDLFFVSSMAYCEAERRGLSQRCTYVLTGCEHLRHPRSAIANASRPEQIPEALQHLAVS
jgi:hypothetical protein